MDFQLMINKRHAVRNYTPQKVEKEKLQQILETARLAPTAANLQPQRLLVLETEENLEKLSKCANIYGAPLAIVVCADLEEAWTRPFDGKQTGDMDASIVTDQMMMAATELGLGSLWVCYFQPDVLREELHIPDHIEPINILALGYEADSNAPQKRRKALSETVYYEIMK
ncbi:MAG: nitroreductase family protein [Bacillota bacterium]|nr:nitroreductase family protein [Bacillota bacterium]